MTEKKRESKKLGAPIPELLEWLNGMPRASQKLLAEKMDTSVEQLRQVAHGYRKCNAFIAVELDKHSGGRISMCKLAPKLDWDHIKLHAHARH